jgi:long-chain acyl-CoA synthetase
MAAFQFVPLAACQGACQLTLRRFDLAEFCATVERERVTHTILVPTMVNFLTLYERLGDYDFRSLRVLVYGGSPMAPEIVMRCREKLPGCKIVQGYGMTETGPGISMLADREHEGERLRSCGRPLAGVEVEIVDEQGRKVGIGERGCIRARGLNIMKGYWNRPEESAVVLRDGWMHTGDIGYEDDAGYLYIVDRQKDMIITGGENVYPAEVETVLYTHAAVREAAVIGVRDSHWGEIVVACVCLHSGVSASEQELRDYCRQRLAGYKAPKKVEFFASELPKAGSGKILRRVLREKFG